MASMSAPRWREKANSFFSTSGVRIKQVGQKAGVFMGEVAKDTGENITGAAEHVNSLVKNRWSLMQQNRLRRSMSSGESVQERVLSAAAMTGTLLKKSISETKDIVTAGKLKVGEAAKKTADKSKIILNNIERWQKGVAENDVFGVPIQKTVQRQKSSKPVPELLVKCADYLVLSGLHTEQLFKKEGDMKIIRQLISLYNNDWNAPLPDGVKTVDVAALIKFYLASLPEPLTTFALHHEIRDARSSIDDLRNILKKLPTVNFMTLEYITALLLQVSHKSSLNKMDAHDLSVEFAPLLIWQENDPRVGFRDQLSNMLKGSSKAIDFAASHSAQDYLSDEADDTLASSHVPLDDGLPTDYSAIEVIRCLIEHHNAIFSDANETIWR